MSRPTALAALLALLPAAASADAALTLSFDLEDVITADYACDGDEEDERAIQVVYVAADEGGLALVPVDGERRIFAQAVSGSGARYVSGQYEWASKGATGLLTDTLEDETLLECGPAVR
jgi:membrane-bound inhibitor of C-type lysozyme